LAVGGAAYAVINVSLLTTCFELQPDQTPIQTELEIDLARNILQIMVQNEAIERLKSLEAELTQIDLDEQNAGQKYAEGFSNTPPRSRDDERAQLATLLGQARPAARTAENYRSRPWRPYSKRYGNGWRRPMQCERLR
jgi:hypothetical protein